MSLILDALKRAERERQSGATVPGVPAGAPTSAPRRRRWRYALLALLASVAAAAAWRVLNDPPRKPAAPMAEVTPQPAPPESPAPVTSAPPPATFTPTPLLPPAASSLRPAPSDALQMRPQVAPLPGTESIESLEELAEEPEPEPVESPPPAREADATSAEAEALAVPEEPEEAPPAVAEPGPEEPTTTAVTPRAEPARPVPPALTQPAPLRRFREMAPEFRADFPGLDLQVHAYEKAPTRRFIVVNGRRYKEGERLAEGPAVIEIVRDGIVLEHRGERFLYPLAR